MKYIASMLMVFCVTATAETPERIMGVIEDLYCGGLGDYDPDFTGWEQSDQNQNKPISGRCVYFIRKSNDSLVGIITGANPYTKYVPSSESHSIVIGRSANFWSCGEPKAKYKEEMADGDIPIGIDYLSCYYTELSHPSDKSLVPTLLDGSWKNSRGNYAEVVMNELTSGDLFTPAVYSVEVIYNKGEDFSEVSMSFTTDDMDFYNNAERPYYQVDILQDCDDPDCYNTDGTVRVFLNKSGTYTLYLDFVHYNNAPIEYGDEWDFEDTVYLRKE